MNRSITYEQAVAGWPDAAADVVAQIRAGRTKDKTTDPATWQWSIVWSVIGKAFSLKEILDGTTRKHRQEMDAKSLDEQVEEELGNRTVVLRGSCRQAPISSEVLRAEVRASLEDAEKERERLAALTPEQRAKEMDAVIAQLRGQPGLVVFKAGG